MSFDDWYNNYELPFNDDSGEVEEQMRVAYNAGLARAAEIVANGNWEYPLEPRAVQAGEKADLYAIAEAIRAEINE